MDGNPGGQKKRGRYSVYTLVFIILISVLFISGYTFVLQKMHSDSILENAVEQNSARTDAMQTGVSGFITRADFTEINSVEDMDTELYKKLQTRLNQIRSMNSTRYFYTAKRGSDGRLIYLVDGLDLGAEDFAFPGTYIEDEMIPFIDRTLSGETVYSQEIIDTTWGHIFTACYPVRASDGSDEILGALCIETDMEPTYEFISERNRIALIVGTVGAACILVIVGLAFVYIRNYNKNQEKQQEMLEKAEAGYYDLILMDIQMPILNGYDAATKIRRMDDKQKSGIPIIAMTANAFSEDKEKAMEVGMNDHVSKPIDMNVVIPALIAQLSK